MYIINSWQFTNPLLLIQRFRLPSPTIPNFEPPANPSPPQELSSSPPNTANEQITLEQPSVEPVSVANVIEIISRKHSASPITPKYPSFPLRKESPIRQTTSAPVHTATKPKVPIPRLPIPEIISLSSGSLTSHSNPQSYDRRSRISNESHSNEIYPGRSINCPRCDALIDRIPYT